MPIYEYECKKCGELVEVNQKMTDPPLKKHGGKGVKCGGKLVKLMSSNAFHLKGSGWYKTDYAKSGSATPPKTETKSACDTCPSNSANK
ncbi:hypothetical protein MNBD_NITROSPINAE01-1800 [hydrothermal vent metagenome]|uniref:Putative regulatory protein FmdB zinc ribbon domain-containing protein n=1 Tax=hydrothermal vent metagenome TaxID=652676 RepID=A0A3B1CIW5_9ZZZZ